MKEVLQSGKPKLVTRGDSVSVLTPVFNSLGDTVAIVEVATRLTRDERGNVK
ncbi:MAG: hypothetical protein HY238_06400 [Acidobacteria bacterium]|nr:hypothetical protein [Acidobacteriota bacterium]